MDGSVINGQSLESESKAFVGKKRDVIEVNEPSETYLKSAKIHDVEIDLCPEGDDSGAKEPKKASVSENEEIDSKDSFEKSKGIYLDLNIEDTSSSINHEPFHPHELHLNSKLRDECGSSIGLFDKKESMNIWKEIKQKSYASTTNGNVPLRIPSPRARKSKSDVLKENIELAKKEEIERFARIAAPSGLLNGLNPGIINHVRNRKQVLSIMEAIVMSEGKENQRHGSVQSNQLKSDLKEHTRVNMEEVDSSGTKELGTIRCEDSASRRMKSCSMFQKPVSLNYKVTKDSNMFIREKKTGASMPLQFTQENVGDGSGLKFFPSADDGSEKNSYLLNESANLHVANSLSMEAANVAFQWLNLLNQDIRGRLSALRRSKKRIRAVIQTELPFLQPTVFSSNQEKNTYTMKDSSVCHPDRATSDAHRVRWSSIFEQMDDSLSKEEIQLENWLNQVKEMQLLCEKGLNRSNLCAQQIKDLAANVRRLINNEADDSEKELALKAAAASIYSTCNFMLLMGKQPC